MPFCFIMIPSQPYGTADTMKWMLFVQPFRKALPPALERWPVVPSARFRWERLRRLRRQKSLGPVWDLVRSVVKSFFSALHWNLFCLTYEVLVPRLPVDLTQMQFSDMEKLKIHAMFPDFVKPGFNAGINALISLRTWMKVKWNRPVRGFIWFHAFAFYCARLFDGGLFLSRRFSFPFSCGSGYHSVRYGLTRSSLRQLFEKYTDDPVTKLKPDCFTGESFLIFFFLFCFFVSVFLTFVQQTSNYHLYAILLVGFDGPEGIHLYIWSTCIGNALKHLVSPWGALPRTLGCRTESLCCSSKCTVCTQLGG